MSAVPAASTRRSRLRGPHPWSGRATVALVATAAAMAATVSAALVPLVAEAAPPSYVALGDSYSSGTGTRTYLADGTACQRSVYAYPSLVAAAAGYDLNFRACSGATVPDVRAAQLGALSATTSRVSISVGGNDAGFADVLTTCALPSWLSSCTRAVDRAQSYINRTLPAALSALYADIRATAPNARVTVVGYPRIFNGTDCNLLTFFSGSEMSRLNATADLINARTSAAARTVGFAFADPTSRFAGHAVCDRPEWINGLSYPVTESYHPNRTGHASGYVPIVSTPLTGARIKVTRDVRRTARSASGALTAQQRGYAALDAGIRPASFEVPDLHSPRALRIADRLGIDVDDPASLRRAERRYAD